MGLRTQLVHSDGLEGGQDTPCQIMPRWHGDGF